MKSPPAQHANHAIQPYAKPHICGFSWSTLSSREDSDLPWIILEENGPLPSQAYHCFAVID